MIDGQALPKTSLFVVTPGHMDRGPVVQIA